MTVDEPATAAAVAAAQAPPRVRRSPWRTALEMLGLGPPPPDGARFHALISYSHATDARLAAALQAGLQRFARPWYRTRALHVFRDNASLSANPHLWRSVQAGLDASQHLILLASSDAAASPWVERECAYWRSTKSCERLLIVLTEGEIAWDDAANDFDRARTTAIPEALRGAFQGEPRWVDLRWASADRDLALSNPRFKEAIAQLAAPLHGVARDEIDSIEVRERRRAVRLARGAAAALAALTVAAVVFAVLARAARNEANREAMVARSTALAVQARDEFGSAAATLTATRPDLGVLLALEAYRLAPTEQARGAVLGALEFTDGIVSYLRSAGGPIDAVAYSPDGRTIAALTANAGVELWSARTRTPIGELQLPPHTLSDVAGGSAIAFSPDGSLLAVTGVGRLGTLAHTIATGVAVWRVRTRRLVGPLLTAPASFAEAVAFAPDGGLVIGTADGAFHLWNPLRGRDLGELAIGCIHSGGGFGETVAVSATATAVVGCPDGSTWVWRTAVAGSAPVRLVPPSSASGAQVAVTGNGAEVGTGYRDSGQVAVWTLTANGYRSTGPPRSLGDTTLRDVRLSPNGAYLAAVYSDGVLRVWPTSGAGAPWSYENTPVSLNGVGWSHDSRTIAVGGDDGLGVLWEAPGPADAAPAPDIDSVLNARAPRGGPAAFAPDGRVLAAVGPGGVRLWSPLTRRPFGPPLPGSSGAARIAVDATELAAVITPPATRADPAPKALLRFWSISNPSGARAASGPLATGMETTGDAAFDPSGRVLALAVTLADDQGGVELWSPGTRTMRLVRLPLVADSVSFDPRAPVLAVGEGQGLIQTIDYAAAAPRARTLVRATASDEGVSDLEYSPDGRTLAAAFGAVVKLLDAASGAVIGTPLRGQNQYRLAFSPDGALLAAADTRGRVQLLDVASEEPFGRALLAVASRAALANGLIAVTDSVSFNADGSMLAAAGSGPVTLWNRLLWSAAEYAQRQARLCGLVGRNLTRLEWSTFLPGEPYRGTCPRWPPAG